MDKERVETMKLYLNRRLPKVPAKIITEFIEGQQKEIDRLKTIELAYEALKKSL